ncbi:MAG: DUF2818 family protein [Thiomonas sp.]|jgi:Protein of unknown function (DUF2818).|uniref:DUF2818 family protein n=2 Tax=Thiomonas TaxID=32012 RepID=D6CVC3_THIA3|nr:MULTISPECIES: DUF2818 family protein [Thiomonas]MDE1979271.1 DUF2818 family protein [Betaproteobacteria bacterium]OZB54591.1 MAG: hypothetical protein B7X43_02950 [Thiomonas sp. 15-63-373]OZB69171.1 MAG: hypothetical protein B7X36_14330 [Thiomonas sp. 14-64-326]CQR45412.1 conserved membrane hypothetical protein [Thiomonas sp. CB3]MBN8742905.1 DUF2818 family protein [Thiomonas arsenitoxydans]
MQNSAIWLVIVLAFVAANLPFVSNRFFLVIPLKKTPKSIWLRLLELLILFFVVGFIGMALEARIGQNYPQHWEFYAVSVAMFLVLAFPGYVLRYMVKRHPAPSRT